MALNILSKLKVVPRACLRSFSTEAKLTSLTVDKSGFATLTFQKPPVNSLNLEFLEEISSRLEECNKNKSRGLIITSKYDGVFSGGLDILEMYKPDPERVRKFWKTLQDAWLLLYGVSYPTVAVINGHAPAGGCLISCCAEYRIMCKNYTIGLNETALGIVAPVWFIDTMKNVTGLRETELAVTSAKMYTTDEALKVGLIDEIVDNKVEGLSRAENFLNRFQNISYFARGITKQVVRQETIQNMIKIREHDLETFLKFVGTESVQKSLGGYLEQLKKKKAAK